MNDILKGVKPTPRIVVKGQLERLSQVINGAAAQVCAEAVREITDLENDNVTLLGAVNTLTTALDDLVTAAQAGTVDRKAVMRARSYLPARCANTLIKKKEPV